MRHFFFAILGIFIMQVSYSQDNYLSGYILTLKGDTLKGYIDNRGWERNRQNIDFKKGLQDDKVVYTPLDIKGFNVEGGNYEGAIVRSEMSPEFTDNLEYGSDLRIIVDTVFLRAIVKGPKSLFYYLNDKSKIQMYYKQDSTYDLLIHKRYLRKTRHGNTVNVDDNSYSYDNIVIKDNNTFQGQLKVYFSDCPKIQSKINLAKYELKSIEKLFYNYFDCTNVSITVREKRAKVKLNYGVLAGLTVTQLKFKSDYFDNFTKGTYNQSNDFSLGLLFDFIFPRDRGRWYFSNELLFTTYNIKGHYRYFVNTDNYLINDTRFNYSYLKLNNMIRYKYPIGKFFVFANAGVSWGFAVKEIDYLKETIKFFGPERTVEGKAIGDTRKFEMGINGGLGLMYNKYSFEIRGERGDGMSLIKNLVTQTNRFYILFGYRFK